MSHGNPCRVHALMEQQWMSDVMIVREIVLDELVAK